MGIDMDLEYFAPCTLGIEPALVGELETLGATRIEASHGGVSFSGDRRLGYAVNLWSRTAIRVQQLIHRERAEDPDALYRVFKKIHWDEFMDVDQTLAIDASVRNSAITHSKYAALKAKDAIVDQFRERLGRRPNVDTKRPHLPLKLLVMQDVASIYLNLSGATLHKRGWRPIQVKSPLNEATAAGLLLLSGWDRASPLIDPMCGSGTFVVEAAWMATDRAPGLNRRFAFMNWPSFDRGLWKSLHDEAEQRVKPGLPFTIEGADHHAGALDLARRGARDAGVADITRFTQSDVRDLEPGNDALFAITNPPYGERLGEGDELKESWVRLGNFLHKRMRGGEAWILSGTPKLPRLLGLKTSRKIPFKNGPLDCRLLQYEIRA
jgi:23S rRNA (guanine2445-N2)-methyltransferase